jgi:hypothetical protein
VLRVISSIHFQRKMYAIYGRINEQTIRQNCRKNMFIKLAQKADELHPSLYSGTSVNVVHKSTERHSLLIKTNKTEKRYGLRVKLKR